MRCMQPAATQVAVKLSLQTSCSTSSTTAPLLKSAEQEGRPLQPGLQSSRMSSCEGIPGASRAGRHTSPTSSVLVSQLVPSEQAAEKSRSAAQTKRIDGPYLVAKRRD